MNNKIRQALIDHLKANADKLNNNQFYSLFSITPSDYCGPLYDILIESGLDPLSHMSMTNTSLFRKSCAREVQFPDNIEVIGGATAFDSELVEIKLPKNNCKVEDAAFSYCTFLKDIYCHKDNIIKAGAFNGCDNIAHIYFDGSEDEFEKLLDGGAFKEYMPELLPTVHYNYKY